MTKIDLDRLRALLAEHSAEPTKWRLLRKGETGALLDEVRALATRPGDTTADLGSTGSGRR